MPVNDRKLFRPRNARNKLNQMGGIMSSSPELIQTVQKFDLGGSVLAGGLPIRPATTFSGTAEEFRMLPRETQQQILNAENRQRSIAGGLSTALKFGSIPVELGYEGVTELASGLYNLGATGLQHVGLADPSKDLQAEIPNLGLVEMFDEVGKKGAPIQNVEELQGILSMQQGEVDPAIARAVQQQAEVTMPKPSVPEEDDLGFDLGDVTDTIPRPKGATTETTTTETSAQPEQQPAPAPEPEIAVFAGDQQAKDVEAAKRGEMGPAEQVKAVVAQGTPEERQDQLKTLMAEFTSNAPKFSGTDKGLAIAKIGFAMAAGQSPRALTNIANALNEGADSLIKDKRERDAFNRQVELSALQYGLGEIGKQRAQDRLDARTFKEYAAGEDGIEYNGQTYNEGETILVSQADILANGGKLPPGLLDKTVYASNVKAAAERTKAIADALEEQAKAGQITDTVLDKRLEAYQKASNTVISAEAGIQLTENAILDVAEGRVTGLNNSLGDLMNRTANSVGIDLGKEYESVADFRSDVRQVFQEMIPVTLGEAQSANSISNRDVEFLADAFITAGALDNGVFSLAAVDQDVLVKQLQGAIRKMRTAQQQAIGQMSSIESRLTGRTVAGEQAESFLEPYRVTVEPYLPTQTGSRGVSAQGQPITSTLGFPMVGQDDQGRNVYDLTGGQ